MRNATCAASKTSKVPTQDALLFISYSMMKVYVQEIHPNVNIKCKHKRAKDHWRGTHSLMHEQIFQKKCSAIADSVIYFE